MTSSKQQFDKLFKQKMQALPLEPTDNAASKLLQDLKQKNKQLRNKTWGKLSLILIVVNTFVVLQLNIRYKQKPATYQARSQFQQAASFALSTSKTSIKEAANQPQSLQTTKPLGSILKLNQAAPSKFIADTWQLLSKRKTGTKVTLQTHRPKVAPSIAHVFEFEGAKLSEQKNSVSETLICGQNKNKTKLVIARSRVAHFKADSLAQDNESGLYRPNGFDEDAVIQYNVYDKRALFSRFQAEQIHWGMVRTTKIAKPEKQENPQKQEKTEKQEKAQKESSPKNKKPSVQTVPKSKVTSATPPSVRPQVHQHGVRQYEEPEYEEYDYFIKNDSLIFISSKVNFVVMMQPDGTILSKAQIEITEPYIYYLGEKRAYFDQKTGKTYLCVATLHHFNFYELEPANGQTNYLFQLENVWPNPDFQIEGHRLFYTYHGKSFQREI